MSEIVTELRTQVRESTYSSDREDAIERLAELYPDADESDRRSIGRTLTDVATDATYGDERQLAQSKLDELFRESAPDIERSAVTAHRRLAIDGDRAAERERALDRLREYQHADLQAELLGEIEETYRVVMEEATHESERRLARDAFAELETASESGGSDGGSEADADAESDAYLAVSLAEHLEAAASRSPNACRKRLEELRSFVEESPVDDDAYAEISSELSEQLRQLESRPSGMETLDPERRDRIEKLAERVRRLYLRSG